MTVYEKIRFMRKYRNLTLDDLAEKLGYKGNSTVSKLERGEIKLTVDMLQELAHVLQVSPEWFISFDDSMPRLDIENGYVNETYEISPEGTFPHFAVEANCTFMMPDSSMKNSKIDVGDLVYLKSYEANDLIDVVKYVKNGDVVLVQIVSPGNEVDLLLRKWFFYPNQNAIILEASNAGEEPKMLTQHDFIERRAVFRGKAVSVSKRLDRG